jgi:ribose 5-phosphate isomerase B
MKIALGADHKGFQLKNDIKKYLEALGHQALDFGTNSDLSVDYPDFGAAAARAVQSGSADLGLVFCWTGTGMAISANKLAGIRSGVALNTDMAELARRHNNVNVLAIPSKYVEPEQAKAIVDAWLKASFDGGRHEGRVAKIARLEAESQEPVEPQSPKG